MKKNTLTQGSSFVSIQDSLPDSVKDLTRSMKMLYETRTTVKGEGNNRKIETDVSFYTDKLLIDISDLKIDKIDPEIIKSDCDFIKKAFDNSDTSDLMYETFEALKSGTNEGMKKAEVLVRKMGLTEEDAIANNGGYVVMFLVLAALILSSGCKGCASTGGSSNMPRPNAGPGTGDADTQP